MTKLSLVLGLLLASPGCGSDKPTDAPAPSATARPHIGPFSDLVTDPAPAPSERPTRVGVAHVLVAYAGAEGAPADVKRSRDEARARAAEVAQKLADPTIFADVARQYSDDASSKAAGGALGNIEEWAFPKAFYEAARALPVGGISEVVETPRGFHIIRRTR